MTIEMMSRQYSDLYTLWLKPREAIISWSMKYVDNSATAPIMAYWKYSNDSFENSKNIMTEEAKAP